MPSPLARLDGDMSRLDRGLVRHHAVSTPSPKAVSAVPSGRGLTAGSCRGRPWATFSPAVRDGDTVAPPGEPGPVEPEPHPARASPATPAAAPGPGAARPGGWTPGAWPGRARPGPPPRGARALGAQPPRATRAPGPRRCH